MNLCKRPPDNWPENGEIEITNLGVRYREGLNLALRGVACHINSNEKVNSFYYKDCVIVVRLFLHGISGRWWITKLICVSIM